MGRLGVILLVFFTGAAATRHSRGSAEDGRPAFRRLFDDRLVVTVHLGRVIRTIPDRFLSVALDTSLVREHWAHFDFSSERLHTLARALSPAYLRLGGTSSDFLLFREPDEYDRVLHWSGFDNLPDWRDLRTPQTTEFNMTGDDWVKVNNFARSVGWDLIFDLNLLLRENGQWNPGNATALLKYSMSQNIHPAGFELGNEPDAFRHLLGHEIDPVAIGKDFLRLHSLISQFPSLKRSVLIGPDVTGQCLTKPEHMQFFEKFLETAGHVLDAVTIHQYYLNGRTATSKDFMDAAVMDGFESKLKVGFDIVQHKAPGKDIWLGETGSAFGGGAVGLSDSYIAGFLWLDKLGVAAKLGVQLVIRQSFYKGAYGMLDFRTLEPRPDYWLSLLYKRLVGERVFSLTLSRPSRNVRAYAHCTNYNRSKYPPGSITLYAMNMLDHDVTFNLSKFKNQEVHIYLLEPPPSEGLLSQNVCLNGKLLKLASDDKLPELAPYIQTSHLVSFPAKTFGFIVVVGANATSCQH